MKLGIGTLSVLALGLLSCSPESSKQYVKPYLETKQVTQDPNVQYFDPSVDILFVIDNSGSMYSHQNNLATNISLFTSIFSHNSVLNYNIGIISTDDYSCWAGNPNCMGGGALVGFPKVVNNSTPNQDAVLAATVMSLGTNGSATEKVFTPTLQALAPSMLSGANAGFYRPTATLAVIFITDAEDQSDYAFPPLTGQGLYTELLKMKGNDKRKVLSYGVIVPSGISNCARDEARDPVRIEEFLGLVVNGAKQQNIFNLCDPQYGTKLAGMAADIVSQVGNIFYLDRMPDRDTIVVTYGQITLPMDPDTGWVFDPARNAILLGNKIDWAAQPSGSRVMVDYKEAAVETRPTR